MANDKYVCPECSSESDAPGQCSDCGKDRLATCAVCGNPVVGEHIHQDG